MEKQRAISLVAKYAQQEQKDHKVLASLTIAQCMLESSWINSALALRANNLFGIKAGTSWKGDYVIMPTTEWYNGKATKVNAKFRRYNSYYESIVDHTNLFVYNGSRYGNLIGEIYYENACASVYCDGYATDPDYTIKLLNIIEQNKLYQYDLMIDVVGQLHKGEKSPRVKILQKLLNRHGSKLDIDGSFGDLTDAAVKEFQAANKIKVDGYVGNVTAGLL